jgi:hypothetical protein
MSNALARRFKVDVSLDGTNWIPLLGLTDFNPQETPTLQSADDYDTNGFNGFEKTMTGAKLAIKARRKLTAGAFDPGQELCRLTRYQFSTSARLYVRWYDRNGAAEAYTGLYLVDYQQAKTGAADIEEVSITFTADGAVTAITNPGTAPLAPVLISATPSGAAAGALVTVTGSYFTGTTGATGVKIGGVNATNYTVVSDNTIVFTVPAGTAGSAPIIVTNPVGASNSLAYTRA